MPKAKTKTKGVLKSDIFTHTLEGSLHAAPKITTVQPPTLGDTPVEAAITNRMSSAVAKSKPKTPVGVTKSKKTSGRESTCRTRSKKGKPKDTIPHADLTFEHNRMQNAEKSISHGQLSVLNKSLVTDPEETEHPHLLPPKKRRNGENALNNRVEYTSMVKRESVLVIRKQISRCDDDDDEDDVPLKKMKHSIDSILFNPCDTAHGTKENDHIVESEKTKAEMKIPDTSSTPIEDSESGETESDSGAILPFETDFDSDKTEPYDYTGLESPPPPVSPLPPNMPPPSVSPQPPNMPPPPVSPQPQNMAPLSVSPLPPTSPLSPKLPPPPVSPLLPTSPLPPTSPLSLILPHIKLDSPPPPQTSSPPLNLPMPKEGSLSPPSFEPIPSTSRDNAVFEKNQEMLQKCMGVDDDCEIIETPVETIDVEEYSPPTSVRHIPCFNAEPIDVDDEEVKFVGYQSIPTFSERDVKRILNKDYTSMDSGNDCEIIDVDEVMAHSDKILQRFKQRAIPSLVIAQAIPMPEQQSIEIDDAFQLRDMDTGNIDDESLQDLYDVFSQINVPPPTLSSDPVMASVTSQQPRTNPQPASAVSSIVDSYFQNNTVPTTSNLVPTTKKSTISNISSTLSNILDALAGSVRSITGATDQSSSSRLPQTASYDLTAASGPVEVVGASHMFNPYRRNYETATSDALPYYVPSSLYQQQGSSIRPVFYMNSLTSAVSVAPMSSVPPIETCTTAPNSKSPETKDTTAVGGRSMECPICLESLSSRQPASTICGHLFCWGCIEKSVNAPGGRRCPTCRKPFSKKGQSYHKIYF